MAVAHFGEVLEFWFGDSGTTADVVARQGKLWFGKSAEADALVTERFGDTLAAAMAGELADWQDSPVGRLALLIVLDQFPHHVWRGDGRSFSCDDTALALALDTIKLGDDELVSPLARVFIYLPLEHAEKIDVQDLSVAMYEKLLADADDSEKAVFENFLDYARKHQEVVARFGRFPHRNEMLGRVSTPEEIDFLRQPGSRF
jgi:uncharacterized protein (DUF924 family)